VTNRCTLAQLREMTAEQVSALDIDQLASLLEDVAALKADAKRLDDLLSTGLALAYHSKAQDIRRAVGKDTGTVTMDMGEYIIRADSPKKVDWNQEALRLAMETVKSWGEDPADYMSMVLSVPESKYNAWPQVIRDVFEPARTVSAGKPSFKIERNKKRSIA